MPPSIVLFLSRLEPAHFLLQPVDQFAQPFHLAWVDRLAQLRFKVSNVGLEGVAFRGELGDFGR